MDELHTSSKSLASSLEQYLAAFSLFANSFDPSFSHATILTILSELESISAYEKKLKQVKAIAHLARNSIPSLVPINALPSDLLTYIFKLVLETHPHLNGGPEDKATPLLGYPDVLSQVCTHWRRVAMDSGTLWSHIDIVPQEFTSSFSQAGKRISSRALLTRAKAFVVRARDASLDVHFGDGRIPKDGIDVDLLTFCATIAPRVKYLRLAIGYLGDSACATFAIFFMTCSPGMLRQLEIVCHYHPDIFDSPFIDTLAASINIDFTDHLSQLPADYVGTLLLPVDVLRLNGLYLTWTSQAYRGLTEMRLIDGRGIITQLQLSGILAASPNLRVLQFGLTVTDAIPRPTPTTLLALRILNLELIDYDSCQALLPLILPGLEPLHLVLRISPPPGGVWDTTPLFTHELEFFLARSTVAELYLESHQDSEDPNYQLLPRLLKQLPLPRLQVLCLRNFDFSYKRTYSLNFPGVTPPWVDEPNIDSATKFTCSKLQVLSFISCNLYWIDIRDVVEALPIQEMKVACSEILAVTRGGMEHAHEYDYYTPERAEREIENIAAFPKIKVESALPKMLRDKWDSWPRQ